MNITINPNLFIRRNDNISNNDNSMQTRNSYPNLAPLACDTVSFGVGEKVLKAGARMTKQAGIDINKTLEKPFKTFERRLQEIFGDLVADEKHPDRPLTMIKNRIKSPESIAEKGGARDCQNAEELTSKIQDLMGGRLVMRDTSRESISLILSRLEDAVNRGVFNITEIENYYAEPRFSYVSEKQLAPLIKSIEKRIGTIRVASEKHPAGYNAIHVTIKMPKNCGNTFAELQIMGSDIDLLKEVEDLSYKISCNKPIQKKYRSMMKYLAPLQGEDTTLKKAFKDYTKQAYMHQRRRKTVPFGEDTSMPEFLDIPWFMPKELDFKFLYKKMQECNEKAAADKKVGLVEHHTEVLKKAKEAIKKKKLMSLEKRESVNK